MKNLIKISVLMVLFAAIFAACRKEDDTPPIPINPEDAVMSFKIENLKTIEINVELASSESEGYFVDIGDGKFLPLSNYIDGSGYYGFDIEPKGKTIRFKGKYTNIVFYNESLSAVDVSQNVLLEKLLLMNDNSGLKQLDLSKNVALKQLYISFSSLTSLDLSRNTGLNRIEIMNSKINQIKLPPNNQIELLRLEDSKLTSINLSECKKLKSCFIEGNAINAIDVSQNNLLGVLYIHKNNLSKIDISKNVNLSYLYIHSNKITEIIAPASLPKLRSVSCHSNLLNNTQMNKLADAVSPQPLFYGSPPLFVCIDKKNPNEKNVISVGVVNKLKNKGWKVYDINGQESNSSGRLEYPGS